MSEDIVLNTKIAEPAMDAGEIEMLRFALDRSRAQFAWKCGGLDSAALNRAYPPSAMTLGGLIKHLALVEDWTRVRATGEPMCEPWTKVDFDADPRWDWNSAADDSPQDIYRLWRDAVERSNASITALLADGGLDQPSQTGFDGDEPPNVRRLLVDLHDEYARHVGHADLFREAIDGLVGEDPPQQ
jgi:hypothetical protein